VKAWEIGENFPHFLAGQGGRVLTGTENWQPGNRILDYLDPTTTFPAGRQHDPPVFNIGVERITARMSSRRRSGPGRTASPLVETVIRIVR
jgi:hypothetical protein